MKRLVAILLSTATGLLLLGSSGSAIAATSTTKALTETATCAFQVSFTWSGYSGQRDVASLKLYGSDGSSSRLLGFYDGLGVSGRSGSISHIFTRSASDSKLDFTGFVSLAGSRGKILYSGFTNTIADLCT